MIPFLAIWFVVTASFMARGMIEPFLGIYSIQSLGQNVVYVGLLFTGFSIASLLVRIPAAILADRYGTELFIALGTALNAVSFALFVLTTDSGLVLLARIIQGAAFAIIQPAILSYATKITIPGLSSRQVISYTSTGFPFGGSMGNAVGGLVLSLGFSALFLTSAILAFVTLGLASAVLGVSTIRARRVRPAAGSNKAETQEVSGTEAEGSTDPPGATSRSPKLFTSSMVLLLLTRTALSYALGAQSTFVPLYALNVLNYSTTDVGILEALLAVFAVVGRPVSNFLVFRIGDRRTMRVATITITVAMLMLTYLPFRELIWVVMVLAGVGVGIFQPGAIMQIVGMVPREKRTLGLGLLTMTFDVGSAVGAAASALALIYGGYTSVFGLSFLVTLVALGIQLRYDRLFSTTEERIAESSTRP